jgi:hypothetical protein
MPEAGSFYINYPVINEHKDNSDKEGIKQIDLKGYVFGRFDFHFDPDVAYKKNLPDQINYKC